MSDTSIEAGFNIFETGRKHRGNFRNYILENVRDVIYAPATRERIGQREALGYYGHGRRVLAGKLDLDEVSRINTPSGSLIIENIPACVTTGLECDGKGNVTHKQDLILENTPGKVVSGLNKSRVGGFSWACDGGDGGRLGVTRMKTFVGMDYVLSPGFSANRGFILESATEDQRDAILEGITALGVSDVDAEAYLKSWLIDAAARAGELEDQISDTLITESVLAGRIEEFEAKEALRLKADAEKEATWNEAVETRKKGILEAVNTCPVAVPEEVLNAILEGVSSGDEFRKVWSFFQDSNLTEMSRLPLPGNTGPAHGQTVSGRNQPDDFSYGTAAAAPDEMGFFTFGG